MRSFTEQEKQTIAIVDRQLEAYNARDIDAFAATYHEEIEVASLSKGVLFQGKEKLVALYEKKFSSLTYLQAISTERIVLNQFLVDYEIARSSNLPTREINQTITAMVAYEVVDRLIRRVTFMQ